MSDDDGGVLLFEFHLGLDDPSYYDVHASYGLCGEYLERHWLPILGPSCVALLRTLGRQLPYAEKGRLVYPVRVLGQWIGVAPGQLRRTAQRLDSFGLVHNQGHPDAYLVPLVVRELGPKHERRLPRPLLPLHAVNGGG